MDADSILDRMIRAIGGKTQSDLGKILGISQASISEAKRKDKVPPEWFLKLSTEKRLNPNWLLTGQGLMHIPERETVDADLLKDVIMAVESFLVVAKDHNWPMTQEIKVKWIVAFYEDFLEEKNTGIQRENIEEEIHHKMGRILL